MQGKQNHKVLKLILLVLATVQSAYWLVYELSPVKEHLWDMNIYSTAIDVYKSGKNPWIGTGYLYHPLFVEFFGLFYPLQKEVFVGLYLACLGFFLNQVSKVSSEHKIVFFIAASFCGVGITGVLSGNVTTFFHFLLIGFSIYGVSKNRWLPFALATIVVSFAKPYFLIFLLIPILSEVYNKKSVLNRNTALAVAAGFLFLAINIFYKLFEPEQMNEFIFAAQSQVADGEPNGFGWYKYIWKLTNSHATASIFYLFFAAFYVSPLIYVCRRACGDHVYAFVFFVYFVLMMLIPRLREYDAFPALFCVFISFFIIFERSKILWAIIPVYSISLINLELIPFAAQRGFFGHYDGLVMLSGLLLYMLLVYGFTVCEKNRFIA